MHIWVVLNFIKYYFTTIYKNIIIVIIATNIIHLQNKY